MRIKALKEKVTATATLLLFSPKTVFAANEIQNAINSSKSSSFDNLDNFLQRMVDMADGWIGAFAFTTSILIWLATSFTKKHRWLGFTCILTALAALIVWLLLPAIISSISG